MAMDRNPSPSSDYKSIMKLQPGDEIRKFFQNEGVLVLDGEIDEGQAYNFYTKVLYMEFNGMFINRPLSIVLNSPGGHVNHGFAIYDSIKMLTDKKRSVDVYGLGLVASMGTVILQAGTRRYATPHTQFLVHQISEYIPFFMSEEVNQLTDRAAEAQRLNNIVMKVIADRAGIELEALKALCHKTNYWVDPEEARQLGSKGLIDEIIITPKFLKRTA